jgi:hypothetical protein
MIDPQFAHATTDVLPITAQTLCKSIQSRNDAGAGGAIAQTVQPFGQRLPVVGGLVLADFNASHCSLKATNWERVAFGCDAAGSAKDPSTCPCRVRSTAFDLVNASARVAMMRSCLRQRNPSALTAKSEHVREEFVHE